MVPCADMTIFSPAPEFGFSAPTFEGTESIDGVAGTVSAEVVITNGVTIAAGLSVTVNCMTTATGSASTGECYHAHCCLQWHYPQAFLENNKLGIGLV